MERKRISYYKNILKKYFTLSRKQHDGTHVSYLKLQNKVHELAANDSEFALLLFEIEAEYQGQGINRWSYLQMSQKFSESNPIELDDKSLLILGDLYHYDPVFQSWCREKGTLQTAVTYWFNKNRHKITHDEEFAKRVLLRKLMRFTLGEVGLEPPVEFDKSERNLFIRTYHTDVEFQEACKNSNLIVRETIVSWLQEYE